jgi:signal transduction histidine kinase
MFLAFLGVVAVPLLLMSLLARSYMKRVRGELDRKFVEEAFGAVRQLREESDAGLARLGDATRDLAHQRVIRQASPRPEVAALVQRFISEHPEVIGVKVEGHFQAQPDKSRIEEQVAAEVQAAIGRLRSWKGDELTAVSQALEALRHLSRPDGPSTTAAGDGSQLLKKLLGEHSQAILNELRTAAAQTVYSNLKDETASTRQHLDLAMEDFFRRAQRERSAELPPIVYEEPDRRLRFFVHAPIFGGGTDVTGMVFVELDYARMIHPQPLYGSGLAFSLPGRSGMGELRYGPEESLRVAALTPPSDVLLRMERERLSTASFRNADDEPFRVYAEMQSGYWNVAVAPEVEIYQPLLWFRMQTFMVIAVSVLFATTLAYRFSGTFVGAVENLKQGMHAISRGEWAHLEKSSRDELGGDLVESVNRMAMTLAERTRREEIANWRRLVRVLSHEINNTLGPVGSVAATIRDRIAPRVVDADAAEDLKLASRLIVERVGALAGFISGYSDLAKLPDPERQSVDFNKLVQSAAQIFAEEAGRRSVRIVQSYDQRVDGALLDPGQMERVVINLVKNALEAAPGASGEVAVRTHRPARGRVELIVEDNGPGIAPDARKNLFVPYFTTKPGGTGIGLALVRQIVLGHGGVVTAEDRPGGGTLMRVVLPVAGGEIA